MKIYDIVQWAIVLGVVVLSALYMLGRIAPQWRTQLAQHLQGPHYAHWINRLGERIGAATGSCGSCDSCGPRAPGKTNKKR